ncbi:MAG: three-Cys-motif partner protein TcmP [Deltaproteobacteria bacterium]|nr:three-Cys-motif partner protein TcmP [Deltaproteobacteria bacterium]
MPVPPKYHNREQTYLKHRVLNEYLLAWGHKLGSRSRFGRVRLWYVDCFAGPWQQEGDELDDTSVCIGLQALEAASATWNGKGHKVDVSAIFVEKKPASFKLLEAFLKQRSGAVVTHAFPGEFGTYVDKINTMIGTDAAFLFVDPTGWTGAAMKYIAPLARVEKRDVLINVMFNHINRFKNDERSFLVRQMREFFGLTDDEAPSSAGEDALMSQYRSRLKTTCSLEYAADLAIPHPTHNRTWFRLVLGCHHTEPLQLFRNVERKVVGEEASSIRDEAQHRGDQQLDMFGTAPALDNRYEGLHQDSLDRVKDQVITMVKTKGKIVYRLLWPQMLESNHLSLTDLNKLVFQMHEANELVIEGLRPRERTPKDDYVISAVAPGSLLKP